MKCEICGDELNKDELYKCERCGKKVCLDCTGNDYPYSTTLCSDCDSSFFTMHEEWMSGKEPVKWQKSK